MDEGILEELKHRGPVWYREKKGPGFWGGDEAGALGCRLVRLTQAPEAANAQEKLNATNR
jgi:hypothetical protein